MAIVKTIQSGTATVHIADDCCAGLSAEELARNWEALRRVVYQIRVNAAKRGTAAAGTSSAPVGAPSQ